jgi:DNA-directed RNA polymerase subunit RPC12/RpoP
MRLRLRMNFLLIFGGNSYFNHPHIMHAKAAVLLLVLSSVFVDTSVVRALELSDRCYHKSVAREHPTSTKWYGCSACGKVVESNSFPSAEVGKCPKRANIIGAGHAWDELGESGSTTYKCSYCVASVSTKSSPSASKCPKSPNKNVGGAWGHQWQKTGESRSGQGSVNRF